MEELIKEVETIIKKKTYSEAHKRATQKYRANNRDKINAQRKKYYENKKNTDNNFLEAKRIKAREYYHRKKALNDKILDAKLKYDLTDLCDETELGKLIKSAIKEHKNLNSV